MKKNLLVLCLSGCSLFTMAQTGTWTRIKDIDSTPNAPAGKVYAVGLGIGSKGYVGTGVNTTHGAGVFSKDFESYDPGTDTWSVQAAFAGVSRSNAAGFAIGSKGYIGTGADSTVSPWTKDFWAYDTVTGAWSQIADFGGAARSSAVGFSIGANGYVGTGENQFGDLSDFWQYDPAANTWTRKADFGGGPRWAAIGLGIGSKGYIGTGNDPVETPTPTFFSDFWEYDPAANTWTKKANFGGGTRASASAFSIGAYGYVGMGNDSLGSDQITYSPQKDLWQYDPATDTWMRQTDLPGSTRWAATGFSVNQNGYIGLGASGACNVCATVLHDFWQFSPAVQNTPPPDSGCHHIIDTFFVYPNPFRDHISIRVEANTDGLAVMLVTDVAGRIVAVKVLYLQKGENSAILETGRWIRGVYYFHLRAREDSRQVKALKE